MVLGIVEPFKKPLPTITGMRKSSLLVENRSQRNLEPRS